MSQFGSRRGDRRKRRRFPDPGRRGSRLGRRIEREISIETEDEDEATPQSSIAVVRLLNKLGPKGRFIIIAFFIALGITLTWVYSERYAATETGGADRFNEAQVSLGKSLYQANCAFCHGDKLEGKPGWDGAFPDGGRPALPLDGQGAITRLSDYDLFDVIKFGGQPFSPADYKNDMPGFEMQLSDADIWAILAYVKSTWPEEAIEQQRALLEDRQQ